MHQFLTMQKLNVKATYHAEYLDNTAFTFVYKNEYKFA